MRRTIALVLIATMNLPVVLFAEGTGRAQANDSLNTIASRWRQRLERVRSETNLIVTLDDGERVEGLLAEVETETFGLLVKPPEGTQLPTRGARLKRHLRFADVVRVTYDNGQPVLPKPLPAQVPAKSFAELQQSVLPGDTVHIQDPSGQRQSGLITEITSSHLTIINRDGQTETVTFRPDEIGRVELETTRTARRTLRGTLIGAGVGLGVAVLALAASDDPDTAEAAPAVAILSVGIGAGLGALVGLASKREIVGSRLVYERPVSGWEINVFPILSKDEKGVGVRVGF